MNNPLLAVKALPSFDQICPEHVEPAMDAVLADVGAALEQIEAHTVYTWDSIMQPLESLEHYLQMTWGAVNHLTGVKNSDALRSAYEAVQPKVIAFSMRLAQSETLYQAYCAMRDGAEWTKLDTTQRRIINIVIRDAELAGIALSGGERAAFNKNQVRLGELNSLFSNHVLDATKAFELILESAHEVTGLPQSALSLAAQSARQAGHEQASSEEGPWRFTLDAPSFGPFMDYAQRSDLREQMYRAYITRASSGELNNEAVILEILQLRQKQAELLGYPDYAAVSLAAKMASGVAAVNALSEQLLGVCRAAAGKEFEELQAFARSEGHALPLKHWDINFWSKRLQENRYAFNDEELRPYFALPNVLDGLFQLAKRLFGISIHAADGEAPIWHKDVRYFNIFRADGAQCAAFYLDPYSRPADKRGGAWMDDCVGRAIDLKNKRVRHPIAHLVCNGTPPIDGKPSLMSFNEVETLFHEFGHGLQHMLTTVNYSMASGISNVEWDAVELPSQFMENWCYDKSSIDKFARHYETGKSIPDALFEKIKAARTYRAASMCLRQLNFGSLDMYLHHEFNAAQSKAGDDSLWQAAQRESRPYNVLEPLAENRFLCSFGHIFAGGYAAGYYSYKWAEVLSADAFAAFEEAGLDNEVAIKEVGQRFADTILALGGSKPAAEVYRAFRGRDANVDALLRHNGLLQSQH